LGTITKLTSAIPNFWERYPTKLQMFFPRPFNDAFRRVAIENGLEPELMFAIARQESGFNSDARSPANAYGLLQLIEPTAEKYASDLNVDHESPKDYLLRPETNIAIAGRYLRNLSQMFQGDNPGIFAAYNAGEYTAKSWVQRRYRDDPVMWIELIPYAETKAYVKNCWRNYFVYSFLKEVAPYTSDKSIEAGRRFLSYGTKTEK